METRPTKCSNVLKVESRDEGLLLLVKSMSTRVKGIKYSKHTSGSAKANRFASARSAVLTIANGASCVHFTQSTRSAQDII